MTNDQSPMTMPAGGPDQADGAALQESRLAGRLRGNAVPERDYLAGSDPMPDFENTLISRNPGQALHTIGEYLDFHPHLHALVADGLVDDQSRFHPAPAIPARMLE